MRQRLQFGLGGGAEHDDAAQQLGERIYGKVKEVCMPERQGLHLVKKQHRAGQGGEAARIPARRGEERVEQLHHSAANDRRALPTAAPCEIYALPGVCVRNEVGVVLENTVIAESFPDALRVLPCDRLVRRKIEDMPRVYALRRLQAKPQPGVGLARAGGEAEPVDPGRSPAAGIPAALGELAAQGVDGVLFRKRNDVRLTAGGKLGPARRTGRAVRPLRQRDAVCEAGGICPVGVHQRAEQQPLYKTARKFVLGPVGKKALQVHVQRLHLGGGPVDKRHYFGL